VGPNCDSTVVFLTKSYTAKDRERQIHYVTPPPAKKWCARILSQVVSG